MELPDPGGFRHWKFSWVHSKAKREKSMTEKTIKMSRNCVQFRKSQRQELLWTVREFDGSISVHSLHSFGICSFRKWDIVWGGGLGWPILLVLYPKSPKIPDFGGRSSPVSELSLAHLQLTFRTWQVPNRNFLAPVGGDAQEGDFSNKKTNFGKDLNCFFLFSSLAAL